MGIHWTGIVFGLLMGSLGYWTTDFLVVQRALAAKDLRVREARADHRLIFKMAVPLIVDPARTARARAVALQTGAGKRRRSRPT